MFPRRVGSAWEIFAPAKLNLYLEVLGKRPDGFHALETLMVPVGVYDHLAYNATDTELNLSVQIADTHSAQLLGDHSDNLILRAARLLAKSAGIAARGRFELVKRIPIQAGMGGGSSDAAAALLLTNEAWDLRLTREQLMPLAAQLGSDVPFFLGMGPSICRGRGEAVESVGRLGKLHFVISKPEAGFSTAEVFARLPKGNLSVEECAKTSKRKLSELVSMLQRGALAYAARGMTNRLESAAESMAPWLKNVQQAFSRAGCLGHFMTGSGSAYVGVARSASHARGMANQLTNSNLGKVFATSSCY